MHNYTRLQLEELKIRYNKKREEEWAIIDSDASMSGAWCSSGHILQLLESARKNINKLIDDLFKIERISLSREQEKLTETYFTDLNKEIIEIAKGEYTVIRSEGARYVINLMIQNDDIINPMIQQEEISTCESINRKIKMLQEELRLGIPQSSTETKIHVSGDVGVINTGAISYSSIKVKLKESNQTELVNALTYLIENIKNSTLGEKEKQEQMENVGYLVDQSVLPPEKRNCGVIKATERFLSTAANLATIWGQVGPSVMKFFGID